MVYKRLYYILDRNVDRTGAFKEVDKSKPLLDRIRAIGVNLGLKNLGIYVPTEVLSTDSDDVLRFIDLNLGETYTGAYSIGAVYEIFRTTPGYDV